MKKIILILALCFTLPAQAQDTFDRAETEKILAEQKIEIDALESRLKEPDIQQKDFLTIRKALRANREIVENLSNRVEPILESVQADIADIGPAPEGENPEPEPDNIREKRADLTEKSLMFSGLIREAEVLTSKTSRLLEKVALMRRGQFIDRLFETQTSPFDITLWQGAAQVYASQIDLIANVFRNNIWPYKLPVTIAISLLLIFVFVSTYISKRSLKKALQIENADRLAAVSRSLIMPYAAILLGMLIVLQTFIAQEIINENSWPLAKHLMTVSIFAIAAILTATRLNKAGLIRRMVCWLAIATSAIYTLDVILMETAGTMSVPLEFTVAQSYIVTSTFAILLGIFSFTILKRPKGEKKYIIPKQIFFFLCALAALILVINTFGYAALGRYIFSRIILLFSLFIGILLIRGAIRPYFVKVDKYFKKDDTQESYIFFWLSFSMDILLFFIALPLCAAIFGSDWVEIREWTVHAFFGMKVGNVTISVANIAIAVTAFLALLFATRFIQNVLSTKILPKTKMDPSIRQSIVQVLGYIGLIISLLISISAVGFDLTNLALIAGALSVGIGFGLQSIVSNFVSGLILLFERPIKVGDWIITASGEGIVKKISVRSTEIETFDRTSIIVPNAELISSSVKNWTHKDRIGRVIITVGVSYDSDPHQVKEMLLKCSMDNPHALNTPEPSVHFKDFGDNALIFDLRFFIRNISELYKSATQMRLDIWDACKEADIEISFPQRDLHIRSAPGLEGLFKNDSK